MPTFADSISASSSAFSSSTRASASSTSARSPGVVSSHSGSAAFAAATAASTSSAPQRGDDRDRLLGRRVQHLHRLAGGGWAPAASDEDSLGRRAPSPATLSHDHRALHVVVDGADVVIRPRLRERQLVALDHRRPERVRRRRRSCGSPTRSSSDEATTLKWIPFVGPPFAGGGSPGPPAGAIAFGLRCTVPSGATARMSLFVLSELNVIEWAPMHPPGHRPADRDLDRPQAELVDRPPELFGSARAGQHRVRRPAASRSGPAACPAASAATAGASGCLGLRELLLAERVLLARAHDRLASPGRR